MEWGGIGGGRRRLRDKCGSVATVAGSTRAGRARWGCPRCPAVANFREAEIGDSGRKRTGRKGWRAVSRDYGLVTKCPIARGDASGAGAGAARSARRRGALPRCRCGRVALFEQRRHRRCGVPSSPGDGRTTRRRSGKGETSLGQWRPSASGVSDTSSTPTHHHSVCRGDATHPRAQALYKSSTAAAATPWPVPTTSSPVPMRTRCASRPSARTPSG